MYKIRLQFTSLSTAKGIPERLQYQDVMTQSICTRLLVNNNIHTTQPDHCTIEFESDRDRTLAQLVLSKNNGYRLRLID